MPRALKLTDKQEAFCQAYKALGCPRLAFAQVFNKKTVSFSILFYSAKIQHRLEQLLGVPEKKEARPCGSFELTVPRQGLTAQQEAFAQHLHRSGELEHAYRLVYGKPSDGKANKMAKGMKIKGRLFELRAGQGAK